MNRTRSISTIVVLAAAAGLSLMASPAAGGGGGHCGPTEGDGGQVELREACFTPSTLRAEPGETITFVNRDGFPHNVSGTGWGHYEDMDRGDRFTMSFADEGIYPFACTLHPGMNGVVLVGSPEEGSGQGPAEAPLVAASTPPSSSGDGWVTAGVVGLAIGAAAGAGITAARHRGDTA